MDMLIPGNKIAKRRLVVPLTAWLSTVGPDRIRGPRIAIAGPSGSGKLHIAEAACAALDMQYVTVDAAEFRAGGLVRHIDPFAQLVAKVDYNLEKISRCIMMVNNVDRLVSTGRSADVEALKELSLALQGLMLSLDVTGRSRSDSMIVDTGKITFILLSTLPFHYVRPTRLEGEAGWRFSDEVEVAKLDEDPGNSLVACGFSRFMVNCLHDIVFTSELDSDTLDKFLACSPLSPLAKMQKDCEAIGVDLRLTEEARKLLARRATARGGGTRTIGSWLTALMAQACFDHSARPGGGGERLLDAAYIESNLFG